jgi:hypothetical protein
VVDDNVQQQRCAVDLHLEQQVAQPVLQRRVDERTLDAPQRRPVDRGGERRRELRLQQLGHLLRLAEDEAKQAVVGARRRHACNGAATGAVVAERRAIVRRRSDPSPAMDSVHGRAALRRDDGVATKAAGRRYPKTCSMRSARSRRSP